MSTHLAVSREERCAFLTVQTSAPDTRVRAVCLFADQIFEGESHVAHDSGASQALRIRLAPPKDVAAELRVHALVGGRGSSACHVFEVQVRLPKFAMFAPACAEDGPESASFVRFRVGEQASQVRAWIAQAFVHDDDAEAGSPSPAGARLVSLRTGRRLSVSVEGGLVAVYADDMELAGDLVQDLSAHLRLAELESEADFPREMEAFRQLLQAVDELNAVRLKMTADMADSSNLVKQLVIRAEDARMLGEFGPMRKSYTQLHALNQELIGEYRKRTGNHEQLLEVRARPRPSCPLNAAPSERLPAPAARAADPLPARAGRNGAQALKAVNHMIQKAARLRVGQAKGRIVTSCRAAIKSNNIHALFKIIQSGKSE